MKIYAIGVLALAFMHQTASAQKPNTLTKAEKKAGWKLLFDGKTLAGWHTFKQDTAGAKWKVKDGTIIFDQYEKKGGGDLVTNEEYENYELSLEWKVEKGSNSGIIFDVQESPKYGATWQTGPEMQVLDNIDADDNKKQNHLAGCLYDMAGDASVSKPVPVGEWNKVTITQDKGHLKLVLNGITTYEGTIGSEEWNKLIENSKFRGKTFADFAKVAKGRIAIQEHPGSSAWRNMKIRVL